MSPAPAPADATLSRVAQLPTWLINRTSALAHGLLGEAFAAAGVRGYQYRLLAALDEFGPSSQATLGRRTSIDRSDVVAAVDDLAARGLVERAPDPQDRRCNIITITGPGATELRKLDSVVTGVQDHLLASLSPADRRNLVRLLTRVLEHHKRG